MKKRFISLIFLIVALIYSIALPSENEKLLAKVNYTFKISPQEEVEIELKRVLTHEGVKLISSHEQYKTLDQITQLKGLHRQVLLQVYGKIIGPLQEKFDLISGNDSIQVRVYLVNPATNEMFQRFCIDRTVVREESSTRFISWVKKSNLQQMMFDSDVEYIEEYVWRDEQPSSGGDEACDECNPDDFDGESFLASAFNFSGGATEMPSYSRGDGVKTGVIESDGQINEELKQALQNQYPNSDLTNMNTVASGASTHGQMCVRLDVGAAPEATAYYIDGITHFDGIIREEIETFSKSAHSAFGAGDFLSFKASQDDIRPVACLPSDNYGIHDIPLYYTYYNFICVGGYDVMNDLSYYGIFNQDFMQYYTYEGKDQWWRASLKTGTEALNPFYDREMPHLLGPSRVACLPRAVKDNLPSGHGLAMTSASAPTLAGVAASVISASSENQNNPNVLKDNPENVKVALMLTSENVDAGYWNPLVDGWDGCGVASGYNAAEFAKNCVVVQPGGIAEHGLSFDEIDKNSSITSLSYLIQTPQSFEDKKHLRAVLTWTASSINEKFSYMGCDLNLELKDNATGEIIGGCYSFEDNVEVIDVPSWKLKTNHQYELILYVDEIDIPIDAIADFIYYSVGWTWVNDFAGLIVNNYDPQNPPNLDLLNRNILIDDMTLPANSDLNVFADNRITLYPGTVISEGSDFKARIRNLFAIYYPGEIYELQRNEITDLSGYGRDGYEFSRASGKIKQGVNQFDMVGTACFDGDSYYELNVDMWGDRLKPPPPSYYGITISLMVQFPDPIEEGYIFSATDETGTKGYYLKVVQVEEGGYLGRLKFYVGENNSNYNEISYDFVQDDLSYGTEILNQRYVHIAAVWSSEEYVRLYVNGVMKESSSSGIIKGYYNAVDTRYFIGRNNTADPNSFIGFKGCIDEVMVYSGPLGDAHILSHFKSLNWPDYQGDHHNVTINPNVNMPSLNHHVEYVYSAGPKIVGSEIITYTTAFRTGHLWGVDIEMFPEYYYEVDYRVLNGEVIELPYPFSHITQLSFKADKDYNAEIFYKVIEDWDSQTLYEQKDKVRYVGNDVCYYCYNQNGSQGEDPPSHHEKWVEIWREGEWYVLGDEVEFNYFTYTCAEEHTADFDINRPPNEQYWDFKD